MTLTADSATRLTAALHENSQWAAKLCTLTRAALPQYLDLRQLCQRYALDAKQLRAVLEKHAIRSQPHGRGLRVHIDEVLRLDSLLRQGAP